MKIEVKSDKAGWFAAHGGGSTTTHYYEEGSSVSLCGHRRVHPKSFGRYYLRMESWQGCMLCQARLRRQKRLRSKEGDE